MVPPMFGRFDANDLGKLVLRVSLGAMMLLHGISKLRHGVDGIEGNLESRGLPAFIAFGVYAGEVLAPLLMIIGWRARVAAAVFAFNMVVATLLVHAGDIFAFTKSGAWAIELQMLYMFGAIAVVFLGAGRLSISGGAGRLD